MTVDPAAKERRRWELSARRENERRRRDAPLLFAAGLVPRVTAEEQQARWSGAQERSAAWLAEREATSREWAARWRREVEQAARPEAFAELEAAWKRFFGPQTPDYEASHWHTAKRRLGLCEPGCACVESARSGE